MRWFWYAIGIGLALGQITDIWLGRGFIFVQWLGWAPVSEAASRIADSADLAIIIFLLWKATLEAYDRQHH